jgi:hypothetical protein
MKKFTFLVITFPFAAFLFYATYREFNARVGREERLSVRWEGLWIPNNYRDVGDSMNGCLGRKDFKEGVITRANVWFSGWSCDSVDNPDVIYSLNRVKARHEQYFCRGSNGEDTVGRFFQKDDLVLSDLEFYETWANEAVKEVACGFFRDSFNEINNGKKILVHCDAGKDRTGTYAALTSALVAEHLGKLDEKMLEAIECDYRKSVRLESHKYGRMRNFVTDLQQRGGIAKFLEEKCQIDQATVTALADRFKGS